MPSSASDPASCTHCGDPCAAEAVERDGLPFCCQGCSTVHQVLLSNGMGAYYQLEKGAGLSLKGREEGQYAYLDEPQFRAKLLDFSDGKVSRVRFFLPQIHCTSCLWLLERLPWLHKGISEARVDYLRKEVSVAFREEAASLREVAELLAGLGYAPRITLEQTEARPAADRSFYYKIGVSGFCAGNIMLMSFPEYLGLDASGESYRQVFGWLNALLSVPIFFYGGNGYLKAAYQALKHGGISIDVPIALGMLALWGQSMYEVLTDTGAGYFDSLAMLVFLLLAGRWFQQRTYQHLSFERDYRSYFPIAVAKVMPGGEERRTSLESLRPGDAIRVRHGELIPADAVLRSGEAHIDYSFITGEAEPVSRRPGELLYAGGRQQGGVLELELAKSVSQSYLTQLWASGGGGPRMQELTDRVGRRFTWVILGIAAGAAAYWWPSSPATALTAFSSVLIIACPCALALNVPFALGNALRVLARHGFFVKDTAALERVAGITQAVFDKTGTIAVAGAPEFSGAPLSDGEQALVKTLAGHSTHPLSQRIGAAMRPDSAVCHEVSGYEEVAGAGIRGQVGGVALAMGSAAFVGAPAQPEADFLTQVHLSVGGEYRGCFRMRQSVREGVPALMAYLQEEGIGLSLLSGDREGEEARMRALLGEGASLRFRQSPHDKAAYIGALQEQGGQVLMVGDGLNDAGALRQADVGIAVSEDAHQFTPACDAILPAGKLAQLPDFHRYARRAMRVVYAGFGLSLLYNVAGLSFAVQGELSPVVAAILMPLSSATVVGWGTLGTAWAARKLGGATDI